jgi:hypothetical protein
MSGGSNITGARVATIGGQRPASINPGDRAVRHRAGANRIPGA